MQKVCVTHYGMHILGGKITHFVDSYKRFPSFFALSYANFLKIYKNGGGWVTKWWIIY